jgi:hypothetical protein
VALALTTAGSVVAVPAASAADPALTLRDSRYVFPLAPPVSTPECNLVFCPVAQPFPAVGSGPDAGVAGLRVTGTPSAPPGVTAEARSEPLPYDGAGDDGTVSVSFSADRVAEGSGGTVLTAVRLQDPTGRVVAQLPADGVPVDGTRRTIGPVAVDPAALTLGTTYVAVATFRFAVPSGGRVDARIFAPRLLALGPTSSRGAGAIVLRPARATLDGRMLRVAVRCPTGPRSCDLQTRSSLRGRTLGKASARVQAGAVRTFTYDMSAAELRRARRVGSILTSVRLTHGSGTVVHSTLRVPRR